MMANDPGPVGACPNCGEPFWPEDNFCQACQADLAPVLVSGGSDGSPDVATQPAGCPDCPDAPVSAEGYCESCGHKVPAPGDHTELEVGPGLAAGVSDRGLRHSRNEDAMALAGWPASGGLDGPVTIAVVCDGVSTSSRPDEAAHAAASSAARTLVREVRTGADPATASADAVRAAQAALKDLAGQPGDAPSATFVSAILTGQEVTVCWLGDCRGYWLDPSGADSRLLTSDDSVAQELIARGLTPAEALASPAGHIVTGWIGADLGDAKPHVVTFQPSGDGVVLLCSDGLWNYLPDAADLASRALPVALTDPRAAAGALAGLAIEAGGRDNVTVLLARFPPTSAPAVGGAAPGDTAGSGSPDSPPTVVLRATPAPAAARAAAAAPAAAATPDDAPTAIQEASADEQPDPH
jgi:serine/threonine protein phosphatase PrpC